MTSNSSGVRAVNRFSSHWLAGLVGQTTSVLAPARAHVRTNSSVRTRALLLKPSAEAAARSRGPSRPSTAAVPRLAAWNSARGQSAVGNIYPPIVRFETAPLSNPSAKVSR